MSIASAPPRASTTPGSWLTGVTCRLEPITSITSAASAALNAAPMASMGICSPNSTTPLFSWKPQSHRGTPSSAASARAQSSSMLTVWSHRRHRPRSSDPCTSITSTAPALVCNRSMFWVMTAFTIPRRCSSATASCAGFGSTAPSMSMRGRWKRQNSAGSSMNVFIDATFMGS